MKVLTVARAGAAFLLVFVLGAACLAGEAAAPLKQASYPFENIGLGGGGWMGHPAVSPVDARLMFMTCDMSGVYRSVDGGRTWKFIHFHELQGATFTKILFDPTDSNVMYDYGGPYDAWALMVSRDAGITWKKLTEENPWGANNIIALGIDRKDPKFLLAGTEKAAYASSDGGGTWRELKGVVGKVKGFHVAASRESAARRVVFVASEDDIFRSDDSGANWKPATAGIEGRKLTGFSGGDDPRSGKTVLFATMESAAARGKFTGGIFRSDDLAATWRSCMGETSGLNVRLGKIDQYGSGDIAQYYGITMPRNQTETVYVAAAGTGYYPPYHNTIYKSTDSGRTWKHVFNGDPRFEGLNVDAGWLKYDLSWGNEKASGIDVSDANGDVVLRTEEGVTHVTTDGGKSWQASYTKLAPGQARPAPGAAWQSTGMEVTTNWDYFFDPSDHKREYICYTDIGFARSLDGGNSWIHSATGSPWANTWYDMVFDSDAPGVIYAACSNVHDIPHATYTAERSEGGQGGVCISTDFGKTWTPSVKGLPESPITSICMDPESPAGKRTLWVTSFGLGVFRSDDSGRTWAAKNSGLGHPKNMRALLIRRAQSGNLYCAIGPLRVGSTFPVPGGLWKSTDRGESWKPINAELNIGWQTGFAIDPKDENVIYSLAASGWQNRQGGVYKTTDGGKTWRQVWRDGSGGFPPAEVQPMFVTIHPDDSKVLYLGTDGHGLFISKDAGESWKCVEGLPFSSVHRVAFDPDDHSKIVVTTFGGGVWRGPAM